MKGIVVFSGSAHPALADEICSHLGIERSGVKIARFSNDCLQAQLLDNCRQRDVYIVQPLVPPTQEHLMELLLMIDAARGATANQITAVMPHYAYARSDKKDASRISLGGRLGADMLSTAGVDEALAGLVGDHRGDRGLARTGWTPQQHRGRGVSCGQPIERRAGEDEMPLTDDLVEPSGPHPGGERLMGVRDDAAFCVLERVPCRRSQTVQARRKPGISSQLQPVRLIGPSAPSSARCWREETSERLRGGPLSRHAKLLDMKLVESPPQPRRVRYVLS